MGQYAELGDVRMYYSVQGVGEPLLLLHPGGLRGGDDMDGQLPLAERYRVYVPDRRGHGRTPDVDGPITYRNMADDTAKFIELLDISPAHLVGYSDGAIVGLLVALRRPELVAKLVMISGWANIDGCVDWAIRWLDALTVDSLPPWLHEGYAERSPDRPEHLPVVAAKLIEEWRSQPKLALTELTYVKAPTLVLIGDDDMITPAYAAAMVGALAEAQLAVVPGTSHGITFEKAELVNRLIFDFLAADQAKKVFTPHELGVE